MQWNTDVDKTLNKMQITAAQQKLRFACSSWVVLVIFIVWKAVASCLNLSCSYFSYLYCWNYEKFKDDICL